MHPLTPASDLLGGEPKSIHVFLSYINSLLHLINLHSVCRMFQMLRQTSIDLNCAEQLPGHIYLLCMTASMQLTPYLPSYTFTFLFYFRLQPPSF